jgi:hypothetical protein
MEAEGESKGERQQAFSLDLDALASWKLSSVSV